MIGFPQLISYQSGNRHGIVIGASKAVGVGGGNVRLTPGEGTGAAKMHVTF